MDIDCKRICYNCREFEHLARNYRNSRIVGQERKLEYGNNMDNRNSNLNGKESQVVFN